MRRATKYISHGGTDVGRTHICVKPARVFKVVNSALIAEVVARARAFCNPDWACEPCIVEIAHVICGPGCLKQVAGVHGDATVAWTARLALSGLEVAEFVWLPAAQAVFSFASLGTRQRNEEASSDVCTALTLPFSSVPWQPP